jgi:hypothetical protein
MRKLTVAAALVALPAAASAAHLSYFAADLGPLNSSGVSGAANLTLDTEAQLLSVHIMASGLVADQPHPQHIHGRFSDAGVPIDSVVPPPSADDDEDGFVELVEGAEFYGPVILPLTFDDGSFPTAPGGMLDFSEDYDLTDSDIFNMDFGPDDLTPLALREIVLHGGLVPPGAGEGTDGIVNGEQNPYVSLLPVASGEIRSVAAPSVIPLPAAAWMLIGGLGALGALARRRRA